MNVSSWDEERLFVQPFIWQRNCKKRDLFNGSFSSQLRALVGCNGFSNDWDTLIHTDLNINCLVSSDHTAGTRSLLTSRIFILLLRTRESPPFIKVKFTPRKNCVVFLNLGQKGANENLLCFNYVFLTLWCPVACSPQHSWHRLKREILKYHYDLHTWCGPSIFSLRWVLVVCGCRRNYLSWGERERERRPWHWSHCTPGCHNNRPDICN